MRVEIMAVGLPTIEAEGLERILLKNDAAKKLWDEEKTRVMIKEVLRDGLAPMGESQKKLVNGIANLTDIQKQCYYLRLFEELPWEEIGKRMGMSGSAARRHTIIAKGKLAAINLGPLPPMSDKAMQQAVSRLKGNHRTFFVLHHVAGMTHTQIMRETGSSMGLVCGTLSMAKARVYIYLDELKKGM